MSTLFAGLATLAAGVLHRSSPVTGVATGTLVAMYVIDLVGKLAEPVEPLRYVSAFKYYGSAIQDGIDPPAPSRRSPSRESCSPSLEQSCSSGATCWRDAALFEPYLGPAFA